VLLNALDERLTEGVSDDLCTLINDQCVSIKRRIEHMMKNMGWTTTHLRDFATITGSDFGYAINALTSKPAADEPQMSRQQQQRQAAARVGQLKAILADYCYVRGAGAVQILQDVCDLEREIDSLGTAVNPQTRAAFRRCKDILQSKVGEAPLSQLEWDALQMQIGSLNLQTL
jgi:hypothetical protein